MKNNLQSEISKILKDLLEVSELSEVGQKKVDLASHLILALIEKHERAEIRDYVWVIEQKEKEIQNLAKLKDPNGLKEVEK